MDLIAGCYQGYISVVYGKVGVLSAVIGKLPDFFWPLKNGIYVPYI